MIFLSWAKFRDFCTSRYLSMQWVDDGGIYWLKAFDGVFSVDCRLDQNNKNDELAEFEATYKATGNKSPNQSVIIQSMPAFAAKTLGDKKLYKRVVGIKQSVSHGDNTLVWTCIYAWAKLMALEICGGDKGDTASLLVLDTAAGTFSGIPNAVLNQFGFSVNIPNEFYRHQSEFDADVYQGLQIKIIYNVDEATVVPKTVGINFVMNEVKS